MADLSHNMRGDLALSPSGDLLALSGARVTQQRVLRRLLTNPGDYIWHLDYGAGLPRMVGTPSNPLLVQGIVSQQLVLERGVGDSPPATASVQADASGAMTVTIRYADQSGAAQAVSFSP